MKYFIPILISLILKAQENAIHGFKEETLNWRLNTAQNKIDYSSRIKLYKNNNFTSGIIIKYNFNLTPDTRLSDIDNNTPDSLVYINYKF